MKKMYAILLAVIGALIVLCVVVGIESCSNKKDRDSQSTEAIESTTESIEESSEESSSEKETKQTESVEESSSVVESLSYTTAYEFSVFKIKEIKDDRVLTVELYDSDVEFDTKNFNLRTFDFSSYYPTGMVDDDYKVFSFYIIYNVVDGVYYLGNFNDLEVGDMFCYMEDASGHCYMILYKQGE